MDINMEAIEKRLLNMVGEKFNTKLSEYLKEVKDQHLLGYKIGFGPSELIYMYFYIEKEFGIKIHEDHIVKGKFSTIDNIVQIICDELKSEDAVEQDLRDSKVS